MKNLLILVCALAAVRAAQLPQNYVPPGQGSAASTFGGATDFGVSRDSGFASQSLSSTSGGVPLPAVSNLEFSASPRQSYSAPAANQGFTGASNSIVSQSLSQPSQTYSAPSSQSIPAPPPPRQSYSAPSSQSIPLPPQPSQAYSAPSSQSLPPPPPPRQSYSAPSGQSLPAQPPSQAYSAPSSQSLPPPPPPRQSYSAPSGQSLPAQPPSQAYSAPSSQSLPPPPPPGQSYSAPSGQGLSEFARQSDSASQNQAFSESSVQSFPVATHIQVSQSVDDQSFGRFNGQISQAIPDQAYSLPAQTAAGTNDQSFSRHSNSLSQIQPAQSYSAPVDQSIPSIPDTLYRSPNGPGISGSSGQKFSSLAVSDDSFQSVPVDPSFLSSNGQATSGSSRQSYSRSNEQSFSGSSGQFASGVAGQSFSGSSGQFASGVTGQSFSGSGQPFTQSAGQSLSGSFDQSFSSASSSRIPGREYSPPRQDTPLLSSLGNAGQGFSSQGVSQNAGYGSQSNDCPEGQVRHVDGQCVVPEIKRHVFVYAAPEQETKYSGPPPNVPHPKVEHNIVFIRTPDQGEGQEPIIVPPPQQKSIIYVLNKGSENQGPRIIEVPVPEKKTPEVYFVNYADGENPTLPDGIDFETALNSAIEAEGQVLGNAEGTSLASANLNNNFEGDNNFISSQDSGVSNAGFNRGTGNGNIEYSNTGNIGGSSRSADFDASSFSNSNNFGGVDVRAGGSNTLAENAVFVGGNDIGFQESPAPRQGFNSFSSATTNNFDAGSATGVALPGTLYSTP